MGPGSGAKLPPSSSHAVSFLLGAALPTALLFLLASDRLGEGLSTISASWRGNGTTAAMQVGAADKPPVAANTLAAAAAGRAQDHEVRTRRLIAPLLSCALHPTCSWADQPFLPL
jgi:hypothetical protein